MSQVAISEALTQEVPKGYQQTEAGLIPYDWIFGELGCFIYSCSSGGTPSRERLEFYKGDIPWISGGELKYNYIKNSLEKITVDAVTTSNLKILPKGTFVIAITGLEAEGTRGACAIVDVPATTNQQVMAIYPKDNLKSNYLFQYYRYKGKELALKYCQGTKQLSYTAKIVKLLPIALPKKIEEQTAIANALSDVDTLLSELEKLIAKKQAIKTAAMQQLLTGKTRLPAFAFYDENHTEGALKGQPKGTKPSELGEIPEDWEVSQLGELVTIASGESPSRFEFVSEGTPYFKVEQLNNGRVYAEETEYRIVTNKTILAGSIIFPKRGASILLNKIRVLKNNSFMDTNLMTLTCKEMLDNMFLYNVLIYQGLDNVADTTSIPQINNKHIIPFLIPLPSKEEQTTIANILSDMDAEIQALTQRLAKTRQIKQGMMQELLTGKTRLVKPEART